MSQLREILLFGTYTVQKGRQERVSLGLNWTLSYSLWKTKGASPSHLYLSVLPWMLSARCPQKCQAYRVSLLQGLLRAFQGQHFQLLPILGDLSMLPWLLESTFLRTLHMNINSTLHLHLSLLHSEPPKAPQDSLFWINDLCKLNLSQQVGTWCSCFASAVFLTSSVIRFESADQAGALGPLPPLFSPIHKLFRWAKELGRGTMRTQRRTALCVMNYNPGHPPMPAPGWGHSVFFLSRDEPYTSLLMQDAKWHSGNNPESSYQGNNFKGPDLQDPMKWNTGNLSQKQK